MSYGGTANVKKCSAWAVKSIWKRDFQPHEQASVFETIYEVSSLVIVQVILTNWPSTLTNWLHVHAWGSSIVCKRESCTAGMKAIALLCIAVDINVIDKVMLLRQFC